MKRNLLRQSNSLRTKLLYKIILGGGSLFMLIFFLATTFHFFNPKVSYALSSGDYQSAGNGNWGTAGTWQKYNGTSWLPAASPPTNGNGVITILSGHTVTVTANVTVDQVVVASGGTVVVNSGVTLSIANDLVTSKDFDVTGILKSAGSISIGLLANLTFENGGKYQHNNTTPAGTIPSATWNAGSTCEIINVGGPTPPSGLNQSFSNFTWNCATQSVDVTLSGAPSTVTGTYSVINTGVGKKLRLASGNSTLTTGNFIQSGGDLTLSTSDNATTTINVSNNFSMTGGTFSFGSGKDGFCNMNITGSWLQSGGAINIQGEKWRSTIIINGNWSQTNGTFTGSLKEQITTITVNGNWSQTGGTFASIEKDQVCTFNIYGDYSHTGGTMSEAGTGATNILFIFKDTGTQTFTASSNTVTGDIDFTVNNGATLVMGTSILKGRKFTLSASAGLTLGDPGGISSSGSTGNIQTSGTRSFSTTANYTFNGSAAQITGNGLPATVQNLTLNNSSNLTLTSTVSVSSVVTLTSGKIITGTNELRTLSTAVASITGYSSSNYIIGNLKRSVTSPGSYDFPLGTSTNYEFANVTLSSGTGIATILGYFTQTNPIVANLGLKGLFIDKYTINKMLDYGYWTLTPNAMTGGSYKVTLKETGQSNGANYPSLYCVLKRTNASARWQSLGTHDSNTQTESGGTVTAVRSGLTSFSDFGIGYGVGFMIFENDSLISGIDGQVGAIYLFPDVSDEIDAWVQILSLDGGATLDDIDHFTAGYDEAFQPYINAATNGASSILWRITFKKANTPNDTILGQISLIAVDVDGNGGSLREFVETNDLNSYSYAPNCFLNITVNNGYINATSPVTNVANIDTTQLQAMFQIDKRNVRTMTYRTGAIGGGTTGSSLIRQNCLFFKPFFNTPVTLPVSLSGFSAKTINNNSVLVNWSTASEQNNDYFTLERSANGKQFSEISKIKGAGSSSIVHKYSYTDETPIQGTSYYRLTQTDYNGHSETFRPVSVSNGSNQNAVDEVSIYPNPFKDFFNARFESAEEEELELQLLNLNGTNIFTQKMNAEKGRNEFHFTPRENLAPGLYIFRISNGKEILSSLKVLCKK